MSGRTFWKQTLQSWVLCGGMLLVSMFAAAVIGEPASAQTRLSNADAERYLAQLLSSKPEQWQQALTLLQGSPEAARMVLRRQLQEQDPFPQRWKWIQALQGLSTDKDLNLLLKLYADPASAWEREITEATLARHYTPVEKRSSLYALLRSASYLQTRVKALKPRQPNQVWFPPSGARTLKLHIMPARVRKRWQRLAGQKFPNRQALLDAFTKDLSPLLWEKWKWAIQPAVQPVPRLLEVKGLLTFTLRNSLPRGLLIRPQLVAWNTAARSNFIAQGWRWVGAGAQRRWQLPILIIVRENQELVRITVQVEELQGRFFPWKTGVDIPIPKQR